MIFEKCVLLKSNTTFPLQNSLCIKLNTLLSVNVRRVINISGLDAWISFFVLLMVLSLMFWPVHFITFFRRIIHIEKENFCCFSPFLLWQDGIRKWLPIYQAGSAARDMKITQFIAIYVSWAIVIHTWVCYFPSQQSKNTHTTKCLHTWPLQYILILIFHI